VSQLAITLRRVYFCSCWCFCVAALRGSEISGRALMLAGLFITWQPFMAASGA
jgi:hypothetical protein